MTKVPRREGTDNQNSGQIYLLVVQWFMMYVLEMWFMTPHIVRMLGGFHHSVAHRLMGSQP